jgi:acetolactate synthase-1/3 small subunit
VSPPAGNHIPGAGAVLAPSSSSAGSAPGHHIVTAMVENKAGVLARVASLFSRITIVVDVESAPLEQIMKQLDKLINVVTITELAPDEAVEREMLLVTVGTGSSAADRVGLEALVREFEGSIVDEGPDQQDGGGGGTGGPVTVMLAGTPGRIDAFEDRVRPFGITELQRTGLVALPKLSPVTTTH